MIRGTVAGALRVLSGSTPPTVLYFIFIYFLISNSSTPLNFDAVTKVTTSFLPLSSFIFNVCFKNKLVPQIRVSISFGFSVIINSHICLCKREFLDILFADGYA